MVDEKVLDREQNQVENFLDHGLAFEGLGYILFSLHLLLLIYSKCYAFRKSATKIISYLFISKATKSNVEKKQKKIFTK
jgi:hypothetical protein